LGDQVHACQMMTEVHTVSIVAKNKYSGQNGDGRWYFDTAAGKDEILARRIGRNELAAMKICGALGEAQAEYHSQPHDGAKQRG
jgi:hypothetical protein